MDTTVNQTEVEETIPAASSASENQTTEEVIDQPSESSGEDIKAPEGEPTTTETGTTKDYSDKAVNRFQEMANRIKGLEEQNSQYSQYFAQPQIYPTVDPIAAKLGQLESQNMLIQETQRLQQKQNLFREAEAKFPEMDPNSNSYSKEFDDAVTGLWEAKGINPVDGAKQMRKLVEKSNYRAIENNQIEMEHRRASSGNAQNRTANSTQTDGQRIINDAFKQFKKSGSTEDHAAYLQAKRKHGN